MPGAGGRGPGEFDVNIAIDEKRVNDLLCLHEAYAQKTRSWLDTRRDDAVATAIVHTYPDKAIAIWKKIAEGHIAQAKVGAYGEAVAYLKKVRKILDGLGRTAEWVDYLANLTEANKRKIRLVQMLHAMSGSPILSK